MATAPAKTASKPSASGSAPALKKKKIPGANKIKIKDLPGFTRQLGAMLSAGLPVVQTLEALEDQTTNQVFKDVIKGIRTQIEGGASFSEALSQYPDLFDELYISMLRAGESGGLLAETTSRIASFLEAWIRLRRKVKSAMMYPSIVMTVALAMAASMIIWIVPVFASIYTDFGAKLPGPTQFLVDLSNGMRHYALVVIVVIVVIAIAFGKFKKTERGAYLWDAFRLKFPVLGDLGPQGGAQPFCFDLRAIDPQRRADPADHGNRGVRHGQQGARQDHPGRAGGRGARRTALRGAG